MSGCGVQAHFTCFDSSHRRSPGMFDELFPTDDTCIQEQVDRGPEPITARDPTLVSKGSDGTARLRIRVPLQDEPRGELSLVGAPAWQDPAVAIRVALMLDDALPETCSARLWIDGTATKPARIERESDDAVRLALDSEQLAELGRAHEAAIAVCGHTLRLDLGARGRIRLFAERFSAARARLLPGHTEASASR